MTRRIARCRLLSRYIYEATTTREHKNPQLPPCDGQRNHHTDSNDRLTPTRTRIRNGVPIPTHHPPHHDQLPHRDLLFPTRLQPTSLTIPQSFNPNALHLLDTSLLHNSLQHRPHAPSLHPLPILPPHTIIISPVPSIISSRRRKRLHRPRNRAQGFLHHTKTIEYVFMMDGELELGLDGGEKRVIRKGEFLVQRASMHSWKNFSTTEGARMAVVCLVAEGAVEPGPG